MTQWWQHISLRSQLTIVVGMVLAVLLSTLGTVLCLSLRQALYQQAERQLHMAAMASKPALRPVMEPTTPFTITQQLSTENGEPTTTILGGLGNAVSVTEPIQDRLHVLANTLTDNRMSALIVAPDGSELARGERAYRFDVPSAPLLEQATLEQLEERDQPSTSIVTKGADRHLTMLIPLRDVKGGLIGALQLASPTRDIDMIVDRFVWFVVGSTSLTLIIGMGLCVLASGRVLRPLHRIVEASQEVADGNYSMRLGLPTGNEVGRLGDAFDHMVGRTAEAFAAQQRFVADAAHELRTPLTAIGGSIEMLQIGAVDHQPEKRRRLLQSVGAEVDRLGRLTNDLLLLSSLEHQRHTHREHLNLQSVLIDLSEQMRLITPEHDIRVELPASLPVVGDADQLRQVFLNILTNARTYTPPRGTITITGSVGDQVVVHVTDTGIGIPAEALPYIWERLYRVERSRSRAAGGSGLGLAIVQTIVKAHGGSTAASSVLDEGTTISITLPSQAVPLNSGV